MRKKSAPALSKTSHSDCQVLDKLKSKLHSAYRQAIHSERFSNSIDNAPCYPPHPSKRTKNLQLWGPKIPLDKEAFSLDPE